MYVFIFLLRSFRASAKANNQIYAHFTWFIAFIECLLCVCSLFLSFTSFYYDTCMIICSINGINVFTNTVALINVFILCDLYHIINVVYFVMRLFVFWTSQIILQDHLSRTPAGFHQE